MKSYASTQDIPSMIEIDLNKDDIWEKLKKLADVNITLKTGPAKSLKESINERRESLKQVLSTGDEQFSKFIKSMQVGQKE